jgi:hypothetical protein
MGSRGKHIPEGLNQVQISPLSQKLPNNQPFTKNGYPSSEIPPIATQTSPAPIAQVNERIAAFKKGPRTMNIDVRNINKKTVRVDESMSK